MAPSIGRRATLALGTAGLAIGRARAADVPTIKIGVLSDMESVYSEAAGKGSVIATQLAVDDFLAAHPDPGFKIEVLAADHHNKPDIGATIVRSWFDRDGVDVITDVPGSAIAIAVGTLAREKDRVALFGGAGAMELSGKACSPNQVLTTYDTYSLVAGTVKPLVAAGADSWFFITADYVFGHSLEDDATRFVKAAGGKVAGSVSYPFPGTTDFSSYILAAQTSGAKVVALMMSGDDMSNCLKQATEFGLTKSGQKLAAGILLITNVHAAGLESTQGVTFTTPFYWDLTDATRAFAKRFSAQYRGVMPTLLHAGAYSGALHYLKAVAALGPAHAKASGRATVEQMKRIPMDDPLLGRGEIRKDGRALRRMLLAQVKSPAESKYPWDFYKILRELPAEEVIRPISADCSFLRG
jgi:branched-chain amino acid transport system substrate-binding protein